MFRKKLRADFTAAYKSIKLPEVEEWFDIYFSRFFGYYLARISQKIGFNPNQVSVLSLVSGVIAGFLFYYQDNFSIILLACFFITLSGVLDSADGQLARMTGQASDLGRKIDAIIDTFVFVACYLAGALYFFPEYSWYIFPLAAVAGWSHSVKSACYEFYKTEFILYLNQSLSHRIPHIDEVKKTSFRGGLWKEFLYYAELDYTRKQAFFVSRSYEDRIQFMDWAFGPGHETFKELYRKYNHSILTWWALICGTNVHRTLLMVCSLFGRIDVYFVVTILTFLPMIWVNRVQKRMDNKLRIAMMKQEKVLVTE